MNKLILKYYIPIKNKTNLSGQNGIICIICTNKGVPPFRTLVPSKRCNSKDPFDIDKWNLKNALLHLKRFHRRKK